MQFVELSRIELGLFERGNTADGLCPFTQPHHSEFSYLPQATRFRTFWEQAGQASLCPPPSPTSPKQPNPDSAALPVYQVVFIRIFFEFVKWVLNLNKSFSTFLRFCFKTLIM